ncbi:hypothetical protein A5320_18180 [Rheinheimera sp. SA_1]|uniref:non-ribosomal peptide synthetase n=1 Tax=Rheinheimera sp. SA_1 TaxID=1827365 RepID=UPI0007FF3331|nr:non-ribosomal peptide synthetase [Rheinheimera sp. SA_1]OBP13478.1 hypothetical protein A5320_18180 [Rheinheimera sp. SA_1]
MDRTEMASAALTTAQTLLERALAQGVVLYLKDGQLRFKAEQGVLSDSLRTELKANRESLIAWLTELNCHTATQLPLIGPYQYGEQTPLSYAQQRLWFIDQLEQDSCQYNIPGQLLLQGAFDVAAFKRAIAGVIRRHEVLRTCLVQTGETVYQHVLEQYELPWQLQDLSALDEAAQTLSLQQLVAEELNQPFDLARDLMVRVRLLKLHSQQHLVLYTLHHIAADGWSMAIFHQELTTLYHAFARGEANPLVPLAIQYRDFALWQRQWLQGELLQQQMRYWQQQLADLPELHNMPLDRPRPLRQQFTVKTVRHTLDARLCQQLNSVCQRHDVTLFMLVHAALAVTLGRFSDSEEIVIGTPVAGRGQQALETLMGLFLNSLVLRTRLDWQSSFAQLLASNRQLILDAFSHQDAPFEQLVELLAPQRQLSHSPLFQIWLVMQNNDQVALSLAEHEGKAVQLSAAAVGGESLRHTAKYELSLYVSQTAKGLHCTWKFQDALFDLATIEYVAGEFDRLLTELAQNVSGRLADYAIFRATDRHNAMVEPLPARLLDAFAVQVRQRPAATALVCGARSYSYQQLDELSGQYATLLARHCQGERVALLFEHDEQMLLAILGALKAGKTYVPLDSSYPAGRLRYMLEHAEVALLLTTEKLRAQAVELAATNYLVVDAAAIAAVTPWSDWASHHVAYILYTSGSTGTPKGVYQAQSHVAALIDRYIASVGMQPADQVLQLASFNFDASVMDVFAALRSGACLHLLDVRQTSPDEVLGYMAAAGISVYHSTPTVVKYLDGASGRYDLSAVHHVVMGGETADPATVKAYLRLFTQNSCFINGFGPTESTLALQHKLSYAALQAGQKPRLGYAVAGINICIETPDGTAAAVYQSGEIVIESNCLALGYWRDPSLTAERFKAGPAQVRRYYTGDQGRLLPDGSVSYLARNDSQVKLRGIRLELGDIEQQLLNVAGVVAAAVTLHEQQLTAHVVSELSVTQLSQQLMQQLPHYMWPANYHVVTALPLTPSGKVDRKALSELAALQGVVYATELQAAAPRNAGERRMVALWQTLLHRDSIGVFDNFFAIGGHSLLATRLINAIAHEFGTRLKLQTIFEYPTVADLCLQLEECMAVLPELDSQISIVERTEAMPLSYAQQRLWFIHQLEPDSVQYNLTGALRLGPAVEPTAVANAVKALLERHEVLRSRYFIDQGEPRQSIVDQFEVPFVLQDCSTLDSQLRNVELQRQLQAEADTPFDLSADLMLRTRLLRFSDDHVLLYTLHHIVGDGWSLQLLKQQLYQLYQSIVTAQPHGLPELKVQYVDYANWQRQWLQGGSLEHELAYWTEKLQGMPVVHALPLDKPRPAEQRFRGRRILQRLDATLTAELKAVCLQLDITLFMLLQTVFALLLARYSNERDIVMATPIAGRQHAELEGLIGFFVNTLVLRTEFMATDDCKTLLQRNRQSILAAYSHQQLPFELLVDKLNPARHLSHNPLTQILFVLQNNERSLVELPIVDSQASITLLEQSVSVKYDLELVAAETGDSLLLGWSYQHALFEAGTVLQLASYLRCLLAAFVADLRAGGGCRIDQLPLQSAADLAAQQQDHHNAVVEYPHTQTIAQLFWAQAAVRGDATALVCGDAQLSYRQLQQRAHRLANRLQRQGVGPEDRIGICAIRSIDTVVGLLAILQAGACYVPLDPAYPPKRLAYIAQHSGLSLILADRQGQQALSAVDSLSQLVSADLLADTKLLPDCAEMAVQCAAAADNLAYIIYTSGSTGEPKGVAISHRNVTSLLWNRFVELGPERTVMCAASLSFDAATFELWGALLHGGKCVLVEEGALALDRLKTEIARHGVDTAWLTAGLFNRIVDEDVQLLSPLRSLLIGGEALSVSHVERAGQALPATCLLNGYGPTENTTFSCVYQIPAATVARRASVPIGRPISNAAAYVLDATGAPAAPGVIGELFVAGDGLARGYLGLAGFTAAKFLPDPFGKAGSRMYRTGDLVRRLPDGELEFIGRADQQLKIRGYRIEPDEIATVIKQLAVVRDAVVVARPQAGGELALVAYLVPHSADAIAAVREHMAALLPEYMLPKAIVTLAELPLTINGKLDKAALPLPDVSAYLRSGYAAAQTQLEQLLTKQWAQVLQLEPGQIGIHDNFFALGGHSLLVVKLQSALSEAGYPVQARDIYAAPTLQHLAALLEQGLAIAAEVPIPPYLVPTQGPLSSEHFNLLSLTEAELAALAQRIPGGLGNIQDIYPLAPLQEGFVFHHLMAPGQDPYLLNIVYRALDSAQTEHFLAGMQALVDRHDAFRTAFLADTISRPVQVVCRSLTLPVRRFTLPAALSVREQLQHWFTETVVQIASAPLLHINQLTAADGISYLHMQIHHLVLDHESLAIINDELRAYAAGQFGQLLPPTPYRAFVASALHQARALDAKAYFSRRLGDIAQTTAPFQLSGLHVDGQQIDAVSRTLDTGLSRRIRALAAERQMSPAVLFHAVWGLLLGRCTDSTTVVFGTVLLGRMQPFAGARSMVGLLMNTLPLRLDLDGDSVDGFIRQTDLALQELLDYEQASLSHAHLCSGLATEVPLFTAVLNYRHAEPAPQQQATERQSYAEKLGGREGTSYPFSLSVNHYREDFSLHMQTDNRVSADQLLEHFVAAIAALVQAALCRPEAALYCVNVLSASQQRRQLTQWNQPVSAAVPNCYLHGWVEQYARSTPTAVAVLTDSTAFSYAELNSRANQVAHYLRAQGIGPDCQVGLCLERGVELLIGLLAVLKAGACYLPLDPAYPPTRLADMLEQSRCRLILSELSMIESLELLSHYRVLPLDQSIHQAALGQYSTEDLAPSAVGLSPDNLCYVIYTSGSTGSPKGVGVTHRGLGNLAAAQAQRFAVGPHSRCLQFASIGFDAAIFEICLAFYSGAALCLLPPLDAKSPAVLREVVSRHQVTHATLPPSVLHYLEPQQLPVTDLIVAGEAVPETLAARWSIGRNFYNAYGPTETTVCATAGLYCAGEVSIGTALPNQSCYILDQDGNLLPVGLTGELYVGGMQLARGYLGRAALTAEHFVPDPFASQPGQRLYRTGDLVRYLPDGTLLFVGRIDHQVKLRGFRIEPGEVEKQLCLQAGVKNCAVLVPAGLAEPQLVGYVVLDTELQSQLEQSDSQHQYKTALRDGYLRQLALSLPDYMVPKVFLFISQLPLTVNGKLDRAALPLPDEQDLVRAHYVAPRNAVEAELCLLWQQLLKLEQVGVDDDFFMLGGHSLLATRLLNAIRQRFTVELSLSMLFQYKTIAALAQVLIVQQPEQSIWHDGSDDFEETLL